MKEFKFTVSDEDAKFIEGLCKKKNMNLTDLILETFEDAWDVMDLEASLEEMKNDPDPRVYTFEEVFGGINESL